MSCYSHQPLSHSGEVMVNLELDKKQTEFSSNVPLIMLLLLFLLFLLLSRSTTSGACSVGPGVAWEPVNSQIVEQVDVGQSYLLEDCR